MRLKLLSAALLVLTSALVAALPGRAEDDLSLARTVAEANNAFGVALYREFAKEPGNLVFSPFSLSSALALTATGARGQTEKELWQALHLDLPREQVAAGYAGVGEVLAGATRHKMITLTVANSLWPQQGNVVSPEFLDIAHRQFSAEVTPLDYTQASLAAEHINRWGEAQTAGRIRRLVSSKMFTPQTRLTLCNAIYLKARWQKKFSAAATRKSAFSLPGGSSVMTDMMRQTAMFHLAEAEDCRLLRLPYVIGETRDGIELVVVLPRDTDGLAQVERSLDGAVLQQWKQQLDSAEYRSVALELPRFKTAATSDCVEALRGMGIRELFDPAAADLSGMVATNDLAVANVLQKAMIDVDENGTEAAAATAMGHTFGFEGNPVLPTPFIVDHPFLFFIRETRTGAILFMGRIVDPRAE